MSQHSLALVVSGLVAIMAFQVGRVTIDLLRTYRQHFHDTADRNLADMFLFVDPSRLFLLHITLVLMLSGVVLLLDGGTFLTLFTGSALGASPPFAYRWLRKRRLRTSVEQLPDALRSMATSLRSGMSLSQAIETLLDYQKPPLGQELGLMLREIRLGVAYEDALDHLHQRLPEIEVQLVTAAMKVSREVGGNLAETLERISDTLRQRLQMEGKIRSLTAQGKLQGLVMTGLPVFLIFALGQLEPRAMEYLFDAWYGWATLAVIVILEVIGYHFIRKIVSIDV